jgi:hypothetical protein
MNLRLSKVNNQLVLTNTELSQDMKRDSSQMRSIALLTMVFLPLSTVAVRSLYRRVSDEPQLTG